MKKWCSYSDFLRFFNCSDFRSFTQIYMPGRKSKTLENTRVDIHNDSRFSIKKFEKREPFNYFE